MGVLVLAAVMLKGTEEAGNQNLGMQSGNGSKQSSERLPKSVVLPVCSPANDSWSKPIALGPVGNRRVEWSKHWPVKKRYISDGKIKIDTIPGNVSARSISFCATNPEFEGMAMPLMWVN